MKSRMIVSSFVLAVTAALCVVMAGCETTETAEAQAAVSPGALPLCKGCGQIKGSDTCCAEGAETCSGCGLAKGSPGCCRIDPNSDEPVALCAMCGQIKGTPECCAEGAPQCDKCGLAKGSPGCCKIETP